MTIEELFQVWVEKELKALKARKRSYLHFDPYISLSNNLGYLRAYLLSPQKVKEHAFYPFIKVDVTTVKYKKQANIGPSIRKIEPKVRPIVYAAHLDAFIYSWYSTLISHEYDKLITSLDVYDNVLAYIEKGKSNIHFATEAFDNIRLKGDCVAMAFDISSFFDSLDHELLKRNWSVVLNTDNLAADQFKIYKSLVDYTYVNKSDLEILFQEVFKKLKKNRRIKNKANRHKLERICTPTEFRRTVRSNKFIHKNSFFNRLCSSSRYGKKCGIPQGTPISAILSNIYMLDFDVALKKAAKELNGFYYRYSDDILFVCSENDWMFAKDIIESEVLNNHLSINKNKTDIVFFKEQKGLDVNGKESKLQYLGFEFDGINAYIRASSLSRYHSRVNSKIKYSLKAAYGTKAIGDSVFKKKLIDRYTHRGNRNFISYAKRAQEIMNSKTIRAQYKNNLSQVLNKFRMKKKAFEDKLNPKNIQRG